MTGVISGRVTWRKRCQALAPSIAIASYSSRGTLSRPGEVDHDRVADAPQAEHDQQAGFAQVGS